MKSSFNTPPSKRHNQPVRQTGATPERLDAFEDCYNHIAEPFDRTFTRDDLDDLLERIADHDPVAPPRLPTAA